MKNINSTKQAILWGGVSFIFYDVFQVLSTIIMARLLSPDIYGGYAVIQTIFLMIASGSCSVFLSQTYEASDKSRIRWDLMYGSAIIINSILIIINSITSFFLYFIYEKIELAIAMLLMSLVFIVEVPASVNIQAMKIRGEWKRLRIIIILGSISSSLIGIFLAYKGFGIYSLVFQATFTAIPPALDFLLRQQRQKISFNYREMREIFIFGGNRTVSSIGEKISKVVEQLNISNQYGLGQLGILSKGFGIGSMFCGRLGSLCVEIIAPIVSSSQPRSEIFRKKVSISLKLMVSIILPIIFIFSKYSEPLILLILGNKWGDINIYITKIMVISGLIGIISMTSNFLVLNLQKNSLLKLEIFGYALQLLNSILLIWISLELYLTITSCLLVLQLIGQTILLIKGDGLSLINISEVLFFSLPSFILSLVINIYLLDTNIFIGATQFIFTYIVSIILLRFKEINFILNLMRIR